MIKARYYEYPLPDVMRYFADGFTPKEGVISADLPPDWFVDTGRGVVVFKLFIEDGRPAPEVESPTEMPNGSENATIQAKETTL